MTTQDLRNEVLSLGSDLRSGKVSTAIARTLLMRAKLVLETMKVEMEATRLGCDIKPIEMDYEDRKIVRKVA